jgi:hypothetical protein
MCLHADWRRWLTYQFCAPQGTSGDRTHGDRKTKSSGADTGGAYHDTHRHPADLFVIQCTLRPLLPTPSPVEVVAVHGITTAVLVGVGVAAGDRVGGEEASGGGVVEASPR